jgi:hypothetical protein
MNPLRKLLVGRLADASAETSWDAYEFLVSDVATDRYRWSSAAPTSVDSWDDDDVELRYVTALAAQYGGKVIRLTVTLDEVGP